MKERVFALHRVRAIAGNTFRELVRLRVFLGVLLFALVIIGASIFVARFTFQQEFQVLKDIALGAMNLATSLLAVVATARLLPQDIDDRTIYAVLAKPVSRLEYLAGRLAGVVVLLAITILIMSALMVAVLFWRHAGVVAETTQQMANFPPDQLAEALRAIGASAFDINLIPAVTILFLKGCLLASLTLFVSTFASTNIFTVFVMTFVYFIGHLQGTAREYWLQTNGAGAGTRVFLALVTLIFPDLQLFNLTDDVVAGSAVSGALFLKTVLLGFFYVVVYLALAWSVFYRKEV